jgi:hypothetical protein
MPEVVFASEAPPVAASCSSKPMRSARLIARSASAAIWGVFSMGAQ